MARTSACTAGCSGLASCKQPQASHLFNTPPHLHHLDRILACAKESTRCVCCVVCAAVRKGSHELRRPQPATQQHAGPGGCWATHEACARARIAPQRQALLVDEEPLVVEDDTVDAPLVGQRFCQPAVQRQRLAAQKVVLVEDLRPRRARQHAVLAARKRASEGQGAAPQPTGTAQSCTPA
eukprot:scaffold2493_cov62-Phaeocystis_antarctica.AAC.2